MAPQHTHVQQDQKSQVCDTCHKPGHPTHQCWKTHRHQKEEYYKALLQKPLTSNIETMDPVTNTIYSGVLVLAFDIGVDPVTGWTRFPEKLHYWFGDYIGRKFPYRFTICLALNEAGRRAKRGFVVWPGDIGKAKTRGPGLYYVGQEWSEHDCKVWDDQTHEERLKSHAAETFLFMDSPVLPIDLQTGYRQCWVREEGDVEDEVDLDAEKDAHNLPTQPAPSPPGAFLTYTPTNPPSISRTRNKVTLSGVPHLSSNSAWARHGGDFKRGIGWKQNRAWMAEAERGDNEDVMRVLGGMWEEREEGVVVPRGKVEV